MPKYFSSESEILTHIRRWTRSPRAPYGIGDDAALVRPAKGKTQAITTDFLVEGVDFKKRDDPALVGRKTLAVNLSDLAAMGAKPRHALLYLAFPQRTPARSIRQFFKGWSALARKYHIEVIGGDLSRGKEWMSGAVLMGERPASSNFLRSGAKAGDSLWVTGTLGGSILGKHFQFEPRVGEAIFLSEHFPISSCIDLSDGLGQDLPRLLEASRKGAHIFLNAIPVSTAARRLSLGSGKSPIRHAFQDGEDFELLFTAGSNCDRRLLKAWKTKFRTPLAKIGVITPGRKVRFFRGGKEASLSSQLLKGYDHFQ